MGITRNLVLAALVMAFFAGGTARAGRTPTEQMMPYWLQAGEVDLNAIEATTPLPADAAPVGATYWSAQFLYWPPLPGNGLRCPVWKLPDDEWLLDDLAVNYNSLVYSLPDQGMAPSVRLGGASDSTGLDVNAWTSPPGIFLTNLTVVLSTNGIAVGFDVAGGSAGVPWDILSTTNLTNNVGQFEWLGIAYTSNHYAFDFQPGQAFYILAKPRLTSIVGFGDDTFGQSDVPYGITNALAVAGGYGQALALVKTNVTAWGSDTNAGWVPSGLGSVTAIACGFYHSVALLTSGSVVAWSSNAQASAWGLTNVPTGLTNVLAIAANGLHSLALCSNGTVVAWGYGTNGETNVPSGLTNVAAIAAGGQHNLAVLSNGTVIAWGQNVYGQTNVPSSVTNALAVAAGWDHSLALLGNGTVVAWGGNENGQCDVPAGLSNVVLIAAGGDPGFASAYSLAVRKDGSLVAWGDGPVLSPVEGLDHVIGLGGGVQFALALRTGPPTPVLTGLPQSQAAMQGESVNFTVKGVGVSGVTYLWQDNGNSISGATNSSYSLTNAQFADAGDYTVIVSDGAGSITSSVAVLSVSQCDPAPGCIVAWWPGNGNADDIIGTNNGTLSPTGSWDTNTGEVQQCFTFDGTNGYVVIPDSPVLDPTNNFTIECWVRFHSFTQNWRTNAPANEQYVIFKRNNTTNGNFEAYALGALGSADTNSGYLAFVIANTNNTAVQADSLPGSIQTNQWYHVACVSGSVGASNIAQLYVNGLLAGQVGYNYAQTYGPYPLVFGGTLATNGYYPEEGFPIAWDARMNGDLDEVSFYDCALSSNEIAAIYQAGSYGKCALVPPTVQIETPTNNARSAQVTPITLTALADQSDGAYVTNVQFFYGGTNRIGAGTLVTSNLYVLSWTDPPLGTNVLTATATDSDGMTNTSASVTNIVVPYLLEVQITAPTNNQVFGYSPTNILLTATVTNIGGTVSNVQFFTNGFLLGTSTFASNLYQLVWWDVLPGTYTITAVALAGTGGTNSASVTNIIIEAMPVVTIVTPTNPPSSQSYQETTNVTLKALAYDSDGTVTQVQFFSWTNGLFTNLLGTATPSGTTSNLTWNNLVAGQYPIIAVAADSRGALAASPIVVLNVAPTNQPPSVSIIDPTNGAVFGAGADITITASASGVSPATVTNVQFFSGTNSLGNDPAAPYSANEYSLAPGTYVLSAEAMDSFGASQVSSKVTITVQNWMPLSVNGYWDSSFEPFDWHGNHVYSSIVPVALGPSDQVFAFNWHDSSEADIELWQSCAWTEPGALQNIDGQVNVMLYGSSGLIIAAPFQSDAFTSDLANYDGTNLTDLAFGLNGDVLALASFQGDLLAGGEFTQTDPVTSVAYYYVARLVGTNWVQVGNELDHPVRTIASINGNLYIGGDFTSADGNSNVAFVAELDGTNWMALDSGVNDSVHSLAVWNNQLLAGGDFTQAGGNTNAAYIAAWDGTAWSPLGNISLATGDTNDNPTISTIAVFGNDVFAGGIFDTITTTSGNTLTAGNIAHLQWDANSQTWSWFVMDQGVTNLASYSGHASVDSIALRKSVVTNSLDVFAGGTFDHAGSVPSYFVARWVIGNNDCTNDLPSVAISSPSFGQAYGTGLDFTIDAFATATPGSHIVSVEFYVDDTSIGSGSVDGDNTNLFYFAENSGNFTVGTHVLDAVATDSGNLINKATDYFIVGNFGDTTLNLGSYQVAVNSPPTPLNVLVNSVGVTGISSVLQLQGTGNAVIGYGGTNIMFQPSPNTFGTNLFVLSATNSLGGLVSAILTVTVVAAPNVEITYPLDGLVTNTNASLVISGISSIWDVPVTNIALYVNGTTYANTNNPTFGFAWSTNIPNFYTFIAVATDANGITNSSPPVTLALTNSAGGGGGGGDVLTASISNLTATPSGSLLATTTYPVVRQGFFDLRGSARDSITTHPVSYQVTLYLPSNPGIPFANVTPPPLDSNGFHDGTDNNGDLGTNNFSGVPNGVYDLQLTVRGGGAETSVTNRFMLDTRLKIGQFSFSEQDIVIPVNGIPLTVTRTYNSMNPVNADFGYNWTYTLDTMDVQLDDVRQDIYTDGNPQSNPVSIRVGGDWDVTLTLPNGRRTTFAFTPYVSAMDAIALWKAPSDVGNTTLVAWPLGSEVIQFFQNGFGVASWQNGGEDSTFDNNDVPGWLLTTPDGTKYYIGRGAPKHVNYTPDGGNTFINVTAYGPPQLTSIVQLDGASIQIGASGITNFAGNNGNTTSTQTRACLFTRDSQGRITAIYDPNGASGGPPAVRYIYNQTTGNLIQVLKLVDASTGTYTTNEYDYNSNFPHYITSIENANGTPVARNYYDSLGRLVAVVDANGNTNQFIHNTTNSMEVTIDPLGHTNTFVYDLNGNVLIKTNALNQAEFMAYDANNNKTNDIVYHNGQPYATNATIYDANNLLLETINPLNAISTYAYNGNAEVTNTVDALGNSSTNYYDTYGNLIGTSDALRDTTTNSYGGNGMLASSQDAMGTLAVNTYDSFENLIGAETLDATGTIILSTNSFAYDANGNRTNATVWRVVGVTWVPSVTSYIYDGQNRVIQTINPDGGTNTVIYNATGQQQATIDPLGHTNSYAYDPLCRLMLTTYPDRATESSAYDANGNRTNSVDRLSRTTTYVYDKLNRLIQTIYPDNTTNTTVYDDVGRVEYSVDARGFTNAFGYDAASERIAVTNAWGTIVAMTNLYGFDANGNQITAADSLNRVTTNVFDALNRQVQVLYPDGTKTSTGYDADGRKVADTNQDRVVTRFAYDGAGRLIAVTNALTNVTTYAYDQAGNQINQVDALGRQTQFAYDGMGRRISRTLPGEQVETMGYDLAGNLLWNTNFNSVIITNQYDVLNRLTSRSSVNGYQVAFVYDAAGNRTNMVDVSGTTVYAYDARNRLTHKAVAWSGDLALALNYGYDANGNVTNIASSSSNGVDLQYSYDPLNRITNVLSSGASAASYGFDDNGNLQTLRYGNGVTNLYQYDALNRLTSLVWKSNQLTLASFYYQLGATGNRTNLTETLLTSVTNRTYAWAYDPLYRLTSENISDLGTLAYRLDPVGNRTNRFGSGSVTNQLPSVTNSFCTNDWLTTDHYDTNGNTLQSTNSAGTVSGPYYYDAANQLTNYSNSVFISYNGDGIRVAKTANGTNTYYLVDDRNPSGYTQVLEEWTVFSGATNLAKVYAYGFALLSQQVPGVRTNFFGSDGHGSTRFLSDAGGKVVNVFAYDAFGTLIASNGAEQTAYLYCGEQFDLDLGLYYNRARYMNPGTSRFWIMDADEGDREDPLSLHKYLYGEDNPLDNVDPSGHEVEGMLAAMDIGFGFFAQISSVTSKATSAAIPLPALPTSNDGQLLVGLIFAESSSKNYGGGENEDEKEEMGFTVLNRTYYSKLKGPHGYWNGFFGSGTVLSALQVSNEFKAYNSDRWKLVMNGNSLKPRAELEKLQVFEKDHLRLSIYAANFCTAGNAPLPTTLATLGNPPVSGQPPVAFNKANDQPPSKRMVKFGRAGSHTFYTFRPKREAE